MRSTLFYIALVCLLSAGIWGVLRIVDDSRVARSELSDNKGEFGSFDSRQDRIPGSRDLTANSSTNPSASLSTTSSTIDTASIASLRDEKTTLAKIQNLLAAADYTAAADLVNEQYSNLSADALDAILTNFRSEALSLQRTGLNDQALRLYLAITEVFDDLQSWSDLSRLAISQEQWPTAFRATLKASTLENDSIRLQRLQNTLVMVAANYRTSLEEQGNTLDVHEMYDSLYKAHPSYARFQYELAFSYLRLNRLLEAQPLLEQLQYDQQLGELSRSALNKLRAQLDELDRQDSIATEPQDNVGPNDENSINIPLSRLGTNLIANVSINQRTTKLLLDTGASITALDSSLIAQLGLRETGRSIQLSTANGRRNAKLYRAERIKLGRFTITGHVVAGIDLSGSSYFSGLLGTDILNAVSRDYSYVIDNQKSALIFIPR